MDDLMKILAVIAITVGGYKVFGGHLPALPSSGGNNSSMSAKATSGPVKCGSVEAARLNLIAAQQELLAAQNSSAGSGGGYQVRNCRTGEVSYRYSNCGVNARSARIQAANQRIQQAQLAYANAQRNNRM